MSTLVVPGVRVEAHFDVLPPLPAPSGIIGIVGVVDRPPEANRLIGVSKVSELKQIIGPGTLYSMKEAVHALSNGASEVVVSAVSGGSAAILTLLNEDSVAAVILKCRFNRRWADKLSAEVRTILDATGNIVRVALYLLINGSVVETFPDLRVAPGQVDDLFDTINSKSNLVVALDAGFQDALPTGGTYLFDSLGTPINVLVDGDTSTLFQLLPKNDIEPDGLRVTLSVSSTTSEINIKVYRGAALQEELSGLTMNPDSDLYLPFVLLAKSSLIQVRASSSLAAGKRLPVATNGPVIFTDGTSPGVNDYNTAIDLLTEDPRIDLICASIEPARSDNEVVQIHQALVAHAVKMADDGSPCIAFGSVTPTEASSLDKIKDHASAVRNRRFVLIAPSGADGAVAGMVGRMNPKESPTFKTVPLFDIAPSSYRESELNRLLSSTTNLLVVQDRAGRGIVVLRALNTIGDQISVTRVADKAIRETKAISENFIGQLNSEDARTALKQQIFAMLTRMEREGALVPSTDGTDPAFIVDVYSTQQDFAQGIVRIDVAIRPVRAIDYIYATIRVKN